MQTFRQALRSRDFALTAELALDADSDATSIIEQARRLSSAVDAIQVPENVVGEVHLSPLATAAILVNAGIDPILHMNCRDKNRVALRGDLLGAAALGISSLLVMRGKEIPADRRRRIKHSYDWGARKLISAAHAMEAADFLIGSVATVFKPDRHWKPEKLIGKADSGVRFIQTQLCFDVDLFRHYMARLVAEKLTHRVNVIVGVAPLPSADIAQWLGKNLRGAVVPAKVVRRLREAADPEYEGISICAELLQQFAEVPGVSGANLVCLGRPEALDEAVRLSGLRGAR